MIETPPNPTQSLPDSYEDRDFGEWIFCSLVRYHEEGLGRFAFEPFESHFEREGDIAHEIAMFSQKLSVKGRLNFKKGLAIALREVGSRKPNAQILKTILRTAQIINAGTILPVILAMLREDARNSEFVPFAISAVASLATNAGETSLTEVSIECLDILSRSDAVDPLSSVTAFILMCKLRPNQVSQNLSIFRGKIDIALGYSEDTNVEDKRQKQRSLLFKNLLEVASVSSLFQSMSNDQVYDRQGGNWWHDLLYFDEANAEELLRRLPAMETDNLVVQPESPRIRRKKQFPKRFSRIRNALQGLFNFAERLEYKQFWRSEG